MIKCSLIDLASGKHLEPITTPGNRMVVGAATEGSSHGVFKTATHGAAGTTVIATPDGDGSIVLTDMILTGEKKAGTLVIQFTDGVNTEIICTHYLEEAPLAFAVSFNGRWQGWRSAHLDMITDAVAEVTATVGYYKVDKGNSLSYSDWDALR